MKKLTIAIILILFLASCEKEILFEDQSCTDSCFYISGVALDKSSQEKLNGVKIRAYVPGGYLQRDTELVHTRTDENGKYSFRIPANKFFYYNSFRIEYSKPGYISHYTREEGSTSVKLDSSLIDSTLYVDVGLVEKAEVKVRYNIVSNAEDISRMRTEFDNELLGIYKPGVLNPGILRTERKFFVPGNQSTKIVFRLEFRNRGDVILEESDEYYFESGETKEIYVNY